MKKTITCKNCGSEISPKIERCPYCGKLTPSEILFRTVRILIIVPFIALLIFIALGYCLGWFSLYN